MSFAVLADKPAGAEQHGCIEQLAIVYLAQTGHQVHLMAAGKVYPSPHTDTVWNRIGVIKGILTTAEKISAIGKLRQHDQSGTAVCGFGGEGKTLTQIIGSIGHANLGIKLNDCYAGGACWFAHGCDLLLLCNRCG